MNKEDFINYLTEWLRAYCTSKLSVDFELLEVYSPEGSLNRSTNPLLSTVQQLSTWEFSVDVLAILKDKKTDKVELIFLNRTSKSISLREIGELRVYSLIANPLCSFMISQQGVSNEVNILMLDEDIQKRCLNYGKDRVIVLGAWDEEKKSLSENSILPIEYRSKIL